MAVAVESSTATLPMATTYPVLPNATDANDVFSSTASQPATSSTEYGSFCYARLRSSHDANATPTGVFNDATQ